MPGDATLDLISVSHRPVAAALTARIDAILARWDRAVDEALPRVDRLTLEALRDDLPRLLNELAATLAAEDADSLDRLAGAVDDRGPVRAGQTYVVDEVMIAFGLLRPILIDEVTAHLGRGLSTEEAAATHLGLDVAARHSVARFTRCEQDRVRAAAEAQSKYLSFLSHDLRGGLNGVLLMVEVLKRELAGEDRFGESMQDLDAMRRSILDTVGTMDRFLHAERFRAGKVQPRMAAMDLRHVLSDAMAGFVYLGKDKGVDVQFDIPAGLTGVADKDLLVLIVQNLVGNAVKYAAAGTAVRLSAAPESTFPAGAAVAGTGPVCLCVVDHGPGIAEHRLATLFDPFTRGETHGQPGVGLGLSIAKQAAELMGADLRVASVLGAGSTFTLTLR